jgi:sugar lactone lactonase YvrE
MAAPQTLIQKWTVTEPYINIHCALGEAPLYEAERNHLRFVDIKKKQLHVIDLAVGPESLKTIQLDVPVGVTADIEGVDSSEKILVGSKYGVAILDRRTEKYTVIKRFYDDKTNDDRMRSNDGAVDPQGRLWIGTMNDFHIDPLQSEGTLFRFDGDFKRTNIREGLTIPNGLGWSRDHKTLFFTHSTEATIYAYDYDEETGAATNQRVFWKLDL